MSTRISKTYVILFLMIAACLVKAGVTFDRESRTMCIVDFPETVPCRPLNLLRADRMNGWDVMSYDKTSDTYTLNANLRIGNNNSTHTYFQIGSPDHLSETLKVKGNIILYPEYVKGENESKGRDWINSLAVGVPGNKDSKACLRIVNGEKSKHTIYITRIPKPDGKGYLHKPFTAFGGTLKVCNGTIGGIGSSPKECMGQPLLYARKVYLENAVIENYKGCFTTGCFPKTCEVKATVFRNGDMAVHNPGFNMQDCTFENIGTAISGFGGAVRITLKNCVFKNNNRNFLLAYRGSVVDLVDCKVGEAKYPDNFQNRVRGKKKLPPAMLLQSKNQKVMVSGPDGKPLAGMKVRITAKNADKSIYSTSGITVTTDKNGSAVALLAISGKSIAKDAKTPSVQVYEYTVKVSGGGYPEKTVDTFKPGTDSGELTVKMDKK